MYKRQGCGNCKHLAYGGGCRRSAYQGTDKINGFDVNCIAREEVSWLVHPCADLIFNIKHYLVTYKLWEGGVNMERQDWEMSVEEFNDCGCAMNGD